MRAPFFAGRLAALALGASLVAGTSAVAQTTQPGPPVPAPPASASSAPPAPAPPAALPQAHPIRLSASIDKQKISLGEPFTLTIEVVHDPADAVALPDPLILAPLSLRAAPTIQRDRVPEGARTRITIPLTDVTSLAPRVPDLTLAVQGPEGARALTVPGQKLELESIVAAEAAPNPEHAHHGPKPPVPVLVRSWLWAGLLVAFALAIAAIVLLARHLRGRRERVVAPPPIVPEDIALARLAALRKREPWKRGEGQAAIFELSETLRQYLGRRLAFDALDLTSDELVRELRRRKLLGLDLTALVDELAWEDLVKFAKVDPRAEDCLSAIDLAESIVRHTREPTA